MIVFARCLIRTWLALLVFAAFASCCCASKETKQTGLAPAAAKPDCGWRKESKSCTTDTDCPAESACVDGLGDFIVPERKDGVEVMPPYERARVRFCQPRACPPEASPQPPPPAEPAPQPAPAK